MKKAKIIIPALGMLLLSTAASITGTVAWFSMNTTVSATGMQVKAQADQVYLQIINEDGLFSDTAAQNTAAAKTATKTIAATNVVKANNTTSVTTFDGTSAVWVTNVSNTPTSAVATGNYVTLDTTTNGDAALANYALINTFKFRLNPTTGVTTAPDPLKATAVTFDTDTLEITDPMRNAVSVFVSSGTNYQLFKQANPVDGSVLGTGVFTEVGSGALTAAAFADSSATGTAVKVYVFFDGDNKSAYTNNITASGYTVQLTFSVDYPND